MDEFEKQNQEIYEAKNALRKKFKNHGFTKQQIEIKMLRLDTDFLMHLYTNGDFLKKSTTKDKLAFYIKALKMYRETE